VCLIGFNKGLRQRAGIEIGDDVIVELERDDEPERSTYRPCSSTR
jgi:bifunctional DNA-binding transcriptional regulator/antitoxin component of YhaV-PrlF toxin-antitoxin module